MLAWRTLAAIVAEHGAGALVSVHRAQGSSPREEGAALLMRPDGAFHGTIGGGRLEWEALREGRAALAAGRGAARWSDHALGPDLGQCCGGRVTVRVETFDRRDGDELARLAEAEGEGGAVEAFVDEAGRVRRGLIPSASGRAGDAGARPLSRRERGRGEGAHASASTPNAVASALHAGRKGWPPHPIPGSSPGQAPLPPGEGARSGAQQAPPVPARVLRDSPSGLLRTMEEGKTLRWIERLGEPRTPLLLFGAGHVGRALVLALAPLPFAVCWIDGRDQAFPPHIPANVRPIRASDSEAELAAAPSGAFVLVMTHDHALDLRITAAALRRADLPFVGLIGSSTKRARFERRFRAIGLSPERIAALACPIGLPGIVGKEPAVIAASVAAQLLRERSRLTPLPAEARELAPA